MVADLVAIVPLISYGPPPGFVVPGPLRLLPAKELVQI